MGRPQDVVADPQTLGEHLLKRRRDLGLLQREVAQRLQINTWTYLNWESRDIVPSKRMRGRVVNFVGYDPFTD